MKLFAFFLACFCSSGGAQPAPGFAFQRAHYRTITGALGGQAYQLLVPAVRVAGTCVLYVHGLGESETAPLVDGLKRGMVLDLLSSGYMVASSNANGAAWGNADSIAAYEALGAHLAANHGVTKLVICAQSMGGIAGLKLIQAGNLVSLVRGWVGIYPACSLSAMYLVYSSSIDAAYNIPLGGTYAAQTSGYDPVLFAGSAFSGIRMRFYASPADTITIKASNADAMKTLVNAYATESDVVVCSGDHGDASHFQSQDLRLFLARCFQ